MPASGNKATSNESFGFPFTNKLLHTRITLVSGFGGAKF